MCNKNGLKLIHHTGDVSMHVDGSNILRKRRDTVYIWFWIYTHIYCIHKFMTLPTKKHSEPYMHIYIYILHHDTFSLNKKPSMIVGCEVTPIPAGGECYCQPQWRKWKPWLSDWMDVHQITKEKGVTNLGVFFEQSWRFFFGIKKVVIYLQLLFFRRPNLSEVPCSTSDLWSWLHLWFPQPLGHLSS